MNIRLAVALPLLLSLIACAPAQLKKMPAPEAHPVIAKKEETHPPLPKEELTNKVMYELLLGEIAGQRGHLDLATDAYEDLSQSTKDYRIAERATQIALYAKRLPQALKSARLWLELDPGSVPAKQTIAAILIAQGKLDEAKSLLSSLLAGEGANIGMGFMHLNGLLAHQKDSGAVLKLIQELAKPYPNVAEAHFAVGRAALAAEDEDLAINELKEALRLKPAWEGAALFLGQMLQRKSPEQVLVFYKSYLKDNPTAREVRLSYAKFLVLEKQYTPAREEFKRLVADFPGNTDVMVAVGLLSLQLNDFDGAENYLKQALAAGHKEENTVRLYLGQIAEEQKRYDEALSWYGSITGGETHFAAQLKFASILAKQGKLDEARQYLNKIPVETNQQRVQVVEMEAELLRNAKKNQEAFDVLGKALEKLPNYPDLLYDYAMAAERLGKLDVLEQELRKLIKIKPDYAQAYNALGYTLADRTDRLDEALQLIEKALKLAPDDAFILDSMGWVQYRMGKNDKAISYLRRALGIRPDPEIAAHLGEVLWVSGNRAEAQKVWETALKENPNHESLIRVMDKFER